MKDELGVDLTLSTYEIMVRMVCNRGQKDMRLKVWDQMRYHGVIPGDAYVFGFDQWFVRSKKDGRGCVDIFKKCWIWVLGLQILCSKD